MNYTIEQVELWRLLVDKVAFNIGQELGDMLQVEELLFGPNIVLCDRLGLLHNQTRLVKSEANRLIDMICKIRPEIRASVDNNAIDGSDINA